MKSLFEPDAAWRDRSPLYKSYREAQQRFSLHFRPTLGSLVSFADNRQRRVHSWYMFKEGYASELVGLFANEFLPDGSRGFVVDPFCGSGTTPLAAAFRGYRACGVEVNPFFVSVASTKLCWNEADVPSLERLVDAVLGPNEDACSVGPTPELTSFERLYSEEVLSELFRLKRMIYEATVAESYSRQFLSLGLTAVLELTSRAYKTGKGLKFRKRQPIHSARDVRARVREKWEQMLDDVRELRYERTAPAAALAVRGDARSLPLEDGCADLIVYSPPYANTFDYNEVYKLEMWFLDYVSSYEEWRRVKEASLRSHVSLRIERQTMGDDLLEQALGFVEAPARGETEMLRAYFSDMGRALAEQKRVARKGGHVVIVVGNSSYRCVPIATDLILARLAEQVGFRVKGIRVGRKLNTSSQQLALYNRYDPDGPNFIRESAVILEG